MDDLLHASVQDNEQRHENINNPLPCSCSQLVGTLCNHTSGKKIDKGNAIMSRVPWAPGLYTFLGNEDLDVPRDCASIWECDFGIAFHGISNQVLDSLGRTWVRLINLR